MKAHQRRRIAITLIESLIVLGIVGILAGILVCVTLKSRASAMQAQSMNNLKQLILATHSYSDAHQGRLPHVHWNKVVGSTAYITTPGLSIHANLLFFIDGGVEYLAVEKASSAPWFNQFSVFLSPADPTAADAVAKHQLTTSYAANAVVFSVIRGVPPAFPGSFRDGISNTIAFAEHYSYDCQGQSFDSLWNDANLYYLHRATFADDGDIRPVTAGQPPVSGPSEGGLTFQVAPTRADCNPCIAQTPHNNGMLAAMADGSVRILGPNMSAATYWGAVTPAGGEILAYDW